MPPISLVTLTKGLNALKKQVETHHKSLQDELSHGDKLDEIYNAVISARKSSQNIDINGVNDNNSDTPESIKPPSRRETLAAVSAITTYLEDVNDPVSRQLEILLHKFTSTLRLEQTKSMRDGLLTDFFTKM